MEPQPNYVLKANEGVLMPKNDNPALGFIKKAVWIVVGIIVIGSLIFQDNLFGKITWSTRILLIALAIGSLFLGGGSVRVPSPFEIWFYDDYLVIYREKFYMDRKTSRKMYDKFNYKEIHKCQYRTVCNKINFYGIVEGIWYDYKKDGSLSESPTYHKTTDSISTFYTTELPKIDFVSEIENHSPIKVIIENN